MKLLIIIFWFVIFFKKLLFWVYLWQLKEYHLGRFRAHFQTFDGKKLIFNYLLVYELFLIPLILFYFDYAIWALFLILLLEFLWTLKHILLRSIKFPRITKKTFLILVSGLASAMLFFFYLLTLPLSRASIFILITDITSPLIASFLVLLFQPLALFWRYRIIKRARKKREKFKNLTVIGITGSYGKTSTKEFLSTILSAKFKVLKTRKHQNSEVGISQCILNDLKPEHEIFICEMGAYSKGGIRLLSDIANPQIGILTGINEQHFSTFGSLENIIKTKYELIENLPQGGLAIFNGDNRYCLGLYQKTGKRLEKRVVFAKAPNETKGDLWAENVSIGKEKIIFDAVKKNGEKERFEVSLLGDHNIQNLLLAIACALELGMSLKEISIASKAIHPLEKGLKLIRKEGLNILDATYSANPNGILSHLKYLRVWEGKRLIVMPCLIELGKSSKGIHQMIGEEIAKTCDLAIITKRECLNDIIKGAERKQEKKIIEFSGDPSKIYKKIKSFSGKNDIILLESRLPENLLLALKIKK